MIRKKVLCRVCSGGLYFTMLRDDTRDQIARLLNGLDVEIYHETIVVDPSDVMNALRCLCYDFEVCIV